MDLLRRGVLEEGAIGQLDVVRTLLEIAVPQGNLLPPAERVPAPIGRLVARDRGVQLPDEAHAEASALADRVHQELERVELGSDHLQVGLVDARLALGDPQGQPRTGDPCTASA